jgi:hypothetical protein
MREIMNREDTFNKVVISPRFTAYLETCSSISEKWSPNQFLDFLLSESANMMYIPEWEANLIEMDKNSLSSVVKSHIQFVDKNKKKFSATKRIITEIDYSITWDKSPGLNQDIILNHLFEALYHLQLATLYDAEADITQPGRLIKEINTILPLSSDPEIKSFLNEFEGLIKTYHKIEIPGTIFSPIDCSTSIKKKVKMLIQDSNYLFLSHQRYELSNTRKHSLLNQIAITARQISYNKKYQDIIKFANLTNHYLPNVVQPVGTFLIDNILSGKQNSPLIVDVDTITYDAELTKSKEDDPDNFDDEGEIIEPLGVAYPWSVYSLPGEPIHKNTNL